MELDAELLGSICGEYSIFVPVEGAAAVLSMWCVSSRNCILRNQQLFQYVILLFLSRRAYLVSFIHSELIRVSSLGFLYGPNRARRIRRLSSRGVLHPARAHVLTLNTLL